MIRSMASSALTDQKKGQYTLSPSDDSLVVLAPGCRAIVRDGGDTVFYHGDRKLTTVVTWFPWWTLFEACGDTPAPWGAATEHLFVP